MLATAKLVLRQTILLNSWSGLCQSRDLRFEVAKLRFETMDQAIPYLREQELAQMLTRARLETEKN